MTTIRSDLAWTDKPWPATVILLTGSMLFTAWCPPLWIVVVPLVLASRRRVKQRYLAEVARQQRIQRRKEDRAYIAACRSMP